MNGMYQEAFDRSFDDEYKSLRRLQELVQEDFAGLLLAEQKRRQPRARVRFKDLPVCVMAQIRDEVKQSPVYKEIERLTTVLAAEEIRHGKLLQRMAPHVEMRPDTCWHLLKTSHSDSYRSQGYGALMYGRGVLEPLLDMLERLGFDTHIRQVNFQRGTGMFAIDHANYELWANCPPWMFDAAYRCLSLYDAVASMKRRCINPLVYNPFLPDECRL